MAISKKKIYWFVSGTLLLGTFLMATFLQKVVTENNPFLTTSSPNYKYDVNLTGQKKRPFFFTVEVRYNVFKEGQTYALNQFLHSGDSMDVSFEDGFSDYRWLDENIVQFYRKYELNASEFDKIYLINNSNKLIKHLKIFSQSKFLIFDVQPLSKITLFDALSKGDIKGIYAEGEFLDGSSFKGGRVFQLKEANPKNKFDYYIYITNDDFVIKNHQ